MFAAVAFLAVMICPFLFSLANFPAAWLSAFLLVIVLTAVWIRARYEAAISRLLVGAVLAGSSLGTWMLLVAWVVDADPSGRSNSDSSRSFWIWWTRLGFESWLGLIALVIVPIAFLAGAVLIGGVAGRSWRAGVDRSRLAA